MTYTSTDFIGELETAFSPIRSQDPAGRRAFAQQIVVELRGFTGDVLKAGAKRLVRERTLKSFPTVAEMIKACATEKRMAVASAPVKMEFEGLEQARGMTAKWDAGERIAHDLIVKTRPNIAIQAAKDGWIGMLWAFVRRNGRLPREKWEVSNCQNEAKAFDNSYEECVKGGFPDAKKLAELGTAMLRRREELRGQVLGAGQ